MQQLLHKHTNSSLYLFVFVYFIYASLHSSTHTQTHTESALPQIHMLEAALVAVF